jgi:hypothetical protein
MGPMPVAIWSASVGAQSTPQSDAKSCAEVRVPEGTEGEKLQAIRNAEFSRPPEIEREPLQDRPRGLGYGGMKRFLIFAVVFPPLALVIFNAPDVIMRHDFRLLDLMTLGLTYSVAVIPALILAGVDWKFRSLAGTTIVGVAIAYLAAFSIGFPFLDYRATLMIGLIGGIPSAVCSWLSALAMRSVK